MSKYSVSVYYEGYDWKKDDKIDAIAQDCGGREVGSGMMIGTNERDVQCVFEDESDAARFQKRVSDLEWLSRIDDVIEY